MPLYNPAAAGGGSGTLTTIEEVDGSPTDSAVTKLVMPNGTLSITSHVATYTDAGGGSAGALVFLEAHTASSSTTLDFTTFISSTYDEYLFEIISLIPSTTNVLGVRCSVSGSFDTGSNYIYSHFVWGSAGSAVGGTTTTSIVLAPFAGRTLVTTANYSTSATLRLFNPQGAMYKEFIGRSTGPDSATTNVQPVEVAGRYVSTSAVDGVRFFVSSGNIASGVIRVYGVSKS